MEYLLSLLEKLPKGVKITVIIVILSACYVSVASTARALHEHMRHDAVNTELLRQICINTTPKGEQSSCAIEPQEEAERDFGTKGTGIVHNGN